MINSNRIYLAPFSRNTSVTDRRRQQLDRYLRTVG